MVSMLAKGSKKWVLVAVALVAILGAGTGAYFYSNKDADNGDTAQTVQPGAICHQEAYDKVVLNYESDTAGQNEIAEDIAKIEASPTFKQSPDCLYVASDYYLNQGDYAKARGYYEDLVKVYNKDKGYDAGIFPFALAPDVYKGMLDMAEQDQGSGQIFLGLPLEVEQ